MAGEEQAAKKPRTEADIKGMTNKQYLDTVIQATLQYCMMMKSMLIASPYYICVIV